MATKSIVIDLEKCIDKEVRVTFQGGREVRGGPLLGLAQGLGRRSQAGVNLEVAQSGFAKYCIVYMARRMVYHA